MKEERLLKEFETLMSELKLLMSSFHPDSKLAELLHQATMKAHKESAMSQKLDSIKNLLTAILVIVIFLFILLIWLSE